VRHERQVFVSAAAAIWPDGHVDPDVGVQARRCFAIIEEALKEAGATLRDVVRTRVFLVDPAHGAAVAEAHGEVFGEVRPASGFIVVRGFLDRRWLVEIEADAIIGA
jgi:enamine deaminase RidA (YjgF/YER057c/UK114 family)